MAGKNILKYNQTENIIINLSVAWQQGLYSTELQLIFLKKKLLSMNILVLWF